MKWHSMSSESRKRNVYKLHSYSPNFDDQFIKVAGRPADIAIDTKRKRIAVPYIALDRVDIWEITVVND